jgi:hypothetical protein
VVLKDVLAVAHPGSAHGSPPQSSLEL